jgi:citrate synthase
MSTSRAKPVTKLSRHTPDAIYYRNDSLVKDLIGKVSFIDVFMSQAFGRRCSEVERRMVDAVLVTLMEHGMTPSAIAARLVYSSSPESLQAGVAAGLLAVGTRFVGTMEQVGVLLGESRTDSQRRLTSSKRFASSVLRYPGSAIISIDRMILARSACSICRANWALLVIT